MFKGTREYLLSLIGASKSRSAPPPTYRVIGDGLIVTATKAEAWFTIGTINTDLMPDNERDATLDSVIRTAAPLLKDADCHLRVVWSTISGAQYAEDMASEYVTGDAASWVRMRAESIDAMGLPERHVLLGVTIAQDMRHDTSPAQQLAASAFSIDHHRVSSRDLDRYMGIMRKLGRSLQQSALRAQLAPAELLSWLLAREQYRTLGAVPRHGLITGANLATLTRGRVDPYPDHLRSHDARGEVVAYTAVLPITDFPEEMNVPGEGEWLRTLSDVTRIEDEDDATAGTEVPVTVEASVRFRIMSRQTALKAAESVRSLAAEQRKSAGKHSAGEVSNEIMESERVSEQLTTEIRRDGLVLVRAHPRLIVTAATATELEANVSAVVGTYGGQGITVSPGTDEQRELWLEALPGDRLRVEDLGHIQDGTAFFGSLFWGGSKLSDTGGSAIGQLAGTTPGLVGFDVTSFARRDQPTTVGIFGRSGEGKTTLMQLAALDAGLRGAWALMLDWKGDTAGLVTAAAALGLPSDLLQLGAAHSGGLDLFRALPLREAPQHVARQLALLASNQFAEVAEDAALAAANHIATQPNPSSWKVVQMLAAANDDRIAQLGRALIEMSRTEIGRVVIGEPTGAPVLRETPGIWVVQVPGLVLPDPTADPSLWDAMQRTSIAAMRAVTTHALYVSSSPRLRTVPKVVAVPEAHRSLKTVDGRDWLDQTARMGRAFGTAILLDSQDVEGIASMEGLVEQLVAVFGFRLVSTRQQDALAAVLGMEEGAWSRQIIQSLGQTVAGEPFKGDALYRDRRGELARIHITHPSDTIRRLLDTNPTRAAERDALAEVAPPAEPQPAPTLEGAHA